MTSWRNLNFRPPYITDLHLTIRSPICTLHTLSFLYMGQNSACGQLISRPTPHMCRLIKFFLIIFLFYTVFHFILFSVSDRRIQRRLAWSLHGKENAIAGQETVEKGSTFLRLLYKLVQVTSEPWVQYTARWEMHISTCKTMRRPWSITGMTLILRSKCHVIYIKSCGCIRQCTTDDRC